MNRAYLDRELICSVKYYLQETLLNKAADLKQISVQVFSYTFCETFPNGFFAKHLRATKLLINTLHHLIED